MIGNIGWSLALVKPESGLPCVCERVDKTVK
jgi:hypothetical protein